MLVFEAWAKPENPEDNLSKQCKEPTRNLTHIRGGSGINNDRFPNSEEVSRGVWGHTFPAIYWM